MPDPPAPWTALLHCRTYQWRAEKIRTRDTDRWDDPVGPAFLGFTLIAVMCLQVRPHTPHHATPQHAHCIQSPLSHPILSYSRVQFFLKLQDIVYGPAFANGLPAAPAAPVASKF